MSWCQRGAHTVLTIHKKGQSCSKKIAEWTGSGVLPEAEISLSGIDFSLEELKPFGPTVGGKFRGYTVKNKGKGVYVYLDSGDEYLWQRDTYELQGEEARAFVELAQRKLEAHRQKEELEARKKAVLEAAGLDDQTIDRRRKEVLKAAGLE